MVKNKKGGRNNRKMASKHAQPTNTSRIRFAKDEDEMYAKVVKDARREKSRNYLQ